MIKKNPRNEEGTFWKFWKSRHWTLFEMIIDAQVATTSVVTMH
jgi:hypothetical protein